MLACFNKKVMLLQIIGRISNYHTDRAYRSSQSQPQGKKENQRCTNAHFIFSGSHRHLMAEMFTSPTRPFYQSVTLMNLKPQDVEKYKKFATVKLEERNNAPNILIYTYLNMNAFLSTPLATEVRDGSKNRE